ncbi:MAG: hypothetical protein AB7T59_15000 [Hyphomonadaceae bacterium]
MRIVHIVSASLLLFISGCGQAAAPADADAQTNDSAAASAQSAEVTAAERTAILSALNMRANTNGQVENECGDMVTPQFVVADVGPGVGRAIAFVIGGGPSAAACYGDGPMVMLMRQANGAWSNIYMVRGGMMIILPVRHNDANDLADGGPGFSFPVRQWNGTTYVSANREVADSALGDARFIPN